MQLILPDIVAEARGLSPGATVFLLTVGLLLWAYGWLFHRFWVVFGITMAAGVLGLSAGRSAGGQQVLVVGILTAVAAGMMAMEAAKLLAFVSGGTAAWLAFQTVLPHAQELWAAFLSGGLIGIVLFRLWTMLVTSLAGSLVAGHAGLVLVSELGKFDATGWAGQHAAALNGAVVASSLVGVVLQAKLSGPDQATLPPEAKPEPAHGEHGEKDKNPKKKADPHPPADDHGKPEAHAKHDSHGKPDEKPAGEKKRLLRLPKFSFRG
jgi:hypothetical protein